MASLAGTDPIKVMLEDIKVVTTETDVNKQESALDDLQDHCDDMDLATGKGTDLKLEKRQFLTNSCTQKVQIRNSRKLHDMNISWFIVYITIVISIGARPLIFVEIQHNQGVVRLKPNLFYFYQYWL